MKKVKWVYQPEAFPKDWKDRSEREVILGEGYPFHEIVDGRPTNSYAKVMIGLANKGLKNIQKIQGKRIRLIAEILTTEKKS